MKIFISPVYSELNPIPLRTSQSERLEGEWGGQRKWLFRSCLVRTREHQPSHRRPLFGGMPLELWRLWDGWCSMC